MYGDLYEAYDKALLEEKLSVHRDQKIMLETQRLDELPALSSMRKMHDIQPQIQIPSSSSTTGCQKSDGFERMKNCRFDFLFYCTPKKCQI